ncbi:DUF6249 domain-containing protein [Chitinophaga sp. Cy-1792]|uniref:DUF6249 domain-containing protein n=1 Tax=Chitinophaga sp. Cy-1792 TaxID=2608339 RepID=UPI00141F3293|nr:DUF6249 domain-containing protein [Chitinophaga sp. Cy-1792]NIG53842.1 hypothetical protein [Chitinophaga sp. Cy-1792]
MYERQLIFSWAILIFVVLVMAAVIYYIRARHKERLELIRRGDYVFESNYLENQKYSALSKGIVLLSLTFGLVLAYILSGSFLPSFFLLCPFCLLGCTGIGMMLYYFILQRKLK